jgi:hypothetical protein
MAPSFVRTVISGRLIGKTSSCAATKYTVSQMSSSMNSSLAAAFHSSSASNMTTSGGGAHSRAPAARNRWHGPSTSRSHWSPSS